MSVYEQLFGGYYKGATLTRSQVHSRALDTEITGVFMFPPTRYD